MSWQYVEFDGVSLPLFDHSQDHGPMVAESTLIDSVGSAYDWRGSKRRAGRRQIISLTGLYVGETEYLVDESGERLVDEGSDPLIAGDAAQMTQAYVTALLEKTGVRGKLWRERLGDSVKEWKTARLLQIGWPRGWEDHAIRAELTCQFETLMEFWHAETAISTSASASDGVPLGLTVNNAGQIVNDAVITVTRTSGTITAFTLTGDGVSLSWSGSLGSGDVLTIDCGAQTVRKGTADAYSGFSLGGSHTAAGWIPISAGIHSFVVTVTGGNATAKLEYYNQYS